MTVADIIDICVWILLFDCVVISGITDNEQIEPERIEKMHEIIDDVFGYFVESGFYDYCNFIRTRVSYERF